jgi:hypothetical protein
MSYLTYSKYPEIIIRKNDMARIPMDSANTDYQIYLRWLAEGNEPEIIEV